eukprot:3725524-Rhodomonas_salina.1
MPETQRRWDGPALEHAWPGVRVESLGMRCKTSAADAKPDPSCAVSDHQAYEAREERQGDRGAKMVLRGEGGEKEIVGRWEKAKGG